MPRWLSTRALLVSALTGAPCTAAAAPRLPAPSQLGVAKTPDGHPEVHLDRLDFPAGIPAGAGYERHLRQVLRREVRRVEWGAGRDNRIEYRFRVTELSITSRDGVVRVTCSATGILAGGKSAHSRLSFGGALNRKPQVVKQVLEIVARGVITRLAELERQRRGLS